MIKQERDILKRVVEYHEGLVPQTVFNNMVGENGKAGQGLIASGYIEEVPRPEGKYNYTAYRASEKGRAAFYSPHKRLWYLIRSDIRTVAVAAITALVTSLIVSFIN